MFYTELLTLSKNSICSDFFRMSENRQSADFSKIDIRDEV